VLLGPWRCPCANEEQPSLHHGSIVSIVGHVTIEELNRYLTRTEMANGLANRFLFACVRRSKALPFGGGHVDLEPLVIRVADRLGWAHERGEQPVMWTDEAKTIWSKVYNELSEGKPGMAGAVTSRAEAHTLRLALVYALLDGKVYIEPEHLNAALAVWKFCDQSAMYLFGAALGDPLADEIRAALKVLPQGLSRMDISNMFKRHQSSENISRALELLAARGLARVEMRPTGGRPEERWFHL
jgi:Protein of unknown function (DUF3987)